MMSLALLASFAGRNYPKPFSVVDNAAQVWAVATDGRWLLATKDKVPLPRLKASIQEITSIVTWLRAEPAALVEYSAESLKRWAPKTQNYDQDDPKALFFGAVTVSKNRLGILLGAFQASEPLMLWDATKVMCEMPCLGLVSKRYRAYLMGFDKNSLGADKVEVFVNSSANLFDLACCGGLGS